MWPCKSVCAEDDYVSARAPNFIPQSKSLPLVPSLARQNLLHTVSGNTDTQNTVFWTEADFGRAACENITILFLLHDFSIHTK